MTELDQPLAGVTVMIIDMSDTASQIAQGFTEAGAKVTLVHGERPVSIFC
jgi:cation diffusion facilitator CzcD-associated flavoprotein CzcO